MANKARSTTGAPAKKREYAQTPIPKVQAAANPGGGTRGQTPQPVVQPPPKKS